MPRDGDAAPDFTTPLATGSIESFTLSERLEAEAPIVLAFFPAAFSSLCTHELRTFEDRMEEFAGTVYGVSVDSPFALNAFREELGLSFDLVSDFEKDVIEAYGVRTDFADLDIMGLARRSVFVVDGDGTVTYSWVSDQPGTEPDYDAVVAAVEEAR